MTNDKPISAYLILFAPWAISSVFESMPITSYWIAWLGSFFIFFISFTGKLRRLPDDRPIADQIMRPVFLMQIIFAGYMCTTTIFYFLDTLGYQDFKAPNYLFVVNQEKLAYLAQCQRYYCLGHASLAAGILAFMKYPKTSKYVTDIGRLSGFILTFSIISFAISSVFLAFPALWQLYYQFSSLSFIAGTLALAFSIPRKKVINIVIASSIYAFNFSEALVSGFKEPIIISVLVLGVFLYPYYKRAVLAIFIPVLIALFVFLPTYNKIFRAENWDGGTNAEVARQLAIDATINGQNDDTNWGFFVYRLSEVDMFITFVKSTPAHINFYGFDLIKQGFQVLVPRIFWPGKPSTEEMIMDRVYNAGVIYRGSTVSAKPAFLVDAYLSYGNIGIVILLFIYGAGAQLISVKAEQLFGGYVLGSALIFSGLFQIFWRGISIEFMTNSIFWSYISMLAIFRLFLMFGIVKRA